MNRSIVFQWFDRNKHYIPEEFIENVNLIARIEKHNVYLITYGIINNLDKFDRSITIIDYNDLDYDYELFVLIRRISTRELFDIYNKGQTSFNFGFIIDLMRLVILLNEHTYRGDVVIYMDMDMYITDNKRLQIDYNKLLSSKILFADPKENVSSIQVFENSLIIMLKGTDYIKKILHILNLKLTAMENVPIELIDSNLVLSAMLTFIKYLIKYNSDIIDTNKLLDINNYYYDEIDYNYYIKHNYIYYGNLKSTYAHSWM
ncbi:hypothetical protein [Alphaentomopoxvirus acuprea]|uniref:Uncharacterized protein n=1 Tax=Alphaentomopoxvirus acuprea TaxID=62099 RepID=W6JIK6_9POXV|nr:hypothetical protein BA82_gp007 [Anomala cuprea entomopoxvirus]YP_009001730.1 hypothetical protein BA82_gp257 [Anomala cuprea entomopoxvirus]BAO49367.1 hypothetical protein [Anomala cuprea entomopoxvirus]BAO49617.1 hypothetical protein [Anomala cuprea entomopoxvirus]